MALTPAQFEKVVSIVIEAFSEDDLYQLVFFRMGTDMYKEWVSHDKPYKTRVFDLITKLEQLGITIDLVQALIGARPKRDDLQAELSAIRDSLTSPGAAAPSQAENIRAGITEVNNHLGDNAVHSAVTQLAGVLRKLADTIRLLRAYKTLHDCLHNIQSLLRGLATAARNLTDHDAKSDLIFAIAELRTVRSSIVAAIDELPNEPLYQGFEREWLVRLDDAIGQAQAASTNSDQLAGRESVHSLKSILRQEPPRIDRSLCKTIEVLQFNDLKDLFGRAGAIATVGNNGNFVSFQVSAEQLMRDVRALANQHTQWQGVDSSLWEAAENVPKMAADESADFSALWSNVKRGIASLLAIEPESEWAKTLIECRDTVDARLKSQDWTMLPVEFSRFRAEATVRFFAVDTTLRQMTDQVGTIGDSLSELLRGF